MRPQVPAVVKGWREGSVATPFDRCATVSEVTSGIKKPVPFIALYIIKNKLALSVLFENITSGIGATIDTFTSGDISAQVHILSSSKGLERIAYKRAMKRVIPASASGNKPRR